MMQLYSLVIIYIKWGNRVTQNLLQRCWNSKVYTCLHILLILLYTSLIWICHSEIFSKMQKSIHLTKLKNLIRKVIWQKIMNKINLDLTLEFLSFSYISVQTNKKICFKRNVLRETSQRKRKREIPRIQKRSFIFFLNLFY